MREDSTFWGWALGTTTTFVVGYLGRVLHARKAQRTKDLRNRIDSICSGLNEIEDLAMEYYMLPGADTKCVAISVNIKTKLKRVGHVVGLLHEDENLSRATHDKSLLTHLVRFRKAVTGGDFESSSRPPYAGNHERFTDITNESTKLRVALEKLYDLSLRKWL